MTDGPDENSAESPLQRALRMKKAAQDARAGAPAGGKSQRAQNAAMPTGVSKPQLKRK